MRVPNTSRICCTSKWALAAPISSETTYSEKQTNGRTNRCIDRQTDSTDRQTETDREADRTDGQRQTERQTDRQTGCVLCDCTQLRGIFTCFSANVCSAGRCGTSGQRCRSSSLSLSLSLSPTLTHSLSLHSLTHSFTLTHFHHSHTLTLALTHSLTHPHSLTHSHSHHSLPHSLTHSLLTPSLSDSLTSHSLTVAPGVTPTIFFCCEKYPIRGCEK